MQDFIFVQRSAEMGIKFDAIKKPAESSVATSSSSVDEDSVWYHEGSGELMAARYWIADYSMPRYGYAKD